MKRKILAICLTLTLLLGAFAVSGCSVVKDVGTISWVKEPAKVYLLNETDKPSFEFKAEIKGKTTNVKYPGGDYDSKVEVNNFTTATVGTRTATVTFEKLTLSFTYKVVNGEFADGTGSSVDPYLVATPVQFQHMLEQKIFNYYKLANSIDFTGVTLKMANKGKDSANSEAWVGELDGNGFILGGISKVLTSDGVVSNKYNEIFGRVGRKNEKFVLKNVTFDFASANESATMGIVTCNGEDAVLEFNGVNVTGYLNAAHTTNSLVAPYVTFVRRDMPFKSIKFINCKNSINIYNSYSVNTVAGFAGAMQGMPDKSVEFDGCTFAGRIEGAANGGVGAFFTSTSENDGAVIVKSNCNAKDGVIVKTADFVNGNVCIKNVDNVDLKDKNVKIDESLNKVNVTSITSDLKITCNVEGKSTITKYVVTVIGGMRYEGAEAFGGQFRYMMPCDATNGELSAYALKKIAYSSATVPDGGDATYGSKLIQAKADGSLVYYGKSVCADIKVDDVKKVVVVAYEGNTAVAFGIYNAPSGTALNFKA